MKLKQTIIDRLQTDPVFRARIEVALGFSGVWVDKLVAANKNNGPLTTIKSVLVIREETGLPDSEILQEETEIETVNK